MSTRAHEAAQLPLLPTRVEWGKRWWLKRFSYPVAAAAGDSERAEPTCADERALRNEGPSCFFSPKQRVDENTSCTFESVGLCHLQSVSGQSELWTRHAHGESTRIRYQVGNRPDDSWGYLLEGKMDAGWEELRLEQRVAEDTPCTLEAARVSYLRDASEQSELWTRHAQR